MSTGTWDASSIISLSVLSTMKEGTELNLIRLPQTICRDLMAAFNMKLPHETSYWLLNRVDWTTCLLTAEGALQQELENLPILTTVNSQVLHSLKLPELPDTLLSFPVETDDLLALLQTVVSGLCDSLKPDELSIGTIIKTMVFECITIRQCQPNITHPVFDVLHRSVTALFASLFTDEELIDLSTSTGLFHKFVEELITYKTDQGHLQAQTLSRWTTSVFSVFIDFMLRVQNSLTLWVFDISDSTKQAIERMHANLRVLKQKLRFVGLTDAQHRTIVQSMVDQDTWAVLPDYIFSDVTTTYRQKAVNSVRVILPQTCELPPQLKSLLMNRSLLTSEEVIKLLGVVSFISNPLQLTFIDLEGLQLILRGEMTLSTENLIQHHKFEQQFTLFSLLQSTETKSLGKLILSRCTYLESLVLEQPVTIHRGAGLLEVWHELSQLPDLFDLGSAINSTFADVCADIAQLTPHQVASSLALLLLQKILPFLRQMSHLQPTSRMLSRYVIERLSQLMARLQSIMPSDARLSKHFDLLRIATLHVTRQNMKLCFDLFLRLKGMIFEYYIKTSVNPNLPVGTKDKTILQFIQEYFPDLFSLFSTTTLKPITADIITATSDGDGVHIFLSELIYSSAFEQQKETAATRLKDYTTQLSRIGPDVQFSFQVIGVNSQPALWMRSAVQVAMFHNLVLDTPVWSEEQLKKLTKTLAQLGGLLFSTLHYHDQLEVAEQIRQAHSEFEASGEVPDVVIPAVGLSRKLDFMCNRLEVIRKLNIYPVHSTVDGVNQQCLRWVTTASGPFQNEALPYITQQDSDFLEATQLKLENYLFKNQIPVCQGNSVKFTRKACVKRCCQPGNMNLIVIEWYCINCHPQHQDLMNFLATDSHHITFIDYYSITAKCAEVAPVTTTTPMQLSEQMVIEANSNCFSEEDVADWTDPFWRFPALPLGRNTCNILEPVINLALSQKIAAMENLRRLIRSTDEVTHLSNLIRRAQFSLCLAEGSPVCTYDSSHGTLITKQPVLSKIVDCLITKDTHQLHRLFDSELSKLIMTPKKLESDENNHSIAMIASETGFSKLAVKQILITCENNQVANVKRSFMTKATGFLTQWIVVHEFTQNVEKMSYLTANAKREQMLKRLAQTAKHIDPEEKSFPIIPSRVLWVQEQWDRLSSDWYNPLQPDHDQLVSHLKTLHLPMRLSKQLSDAFVLQDYSSDHLHLIQDCLHELCKVNGFAFSIAIQELVRVVDELTNTKVGPATLAWRTMTGFPIQILCTTTTSRSDSSTPIQVVLFCEAIELRDNVVLGVTRTSLARPTWHPVPGTTLMRSHTFRLDGRMIRQALATPLYLMDNVLSELQDDRHINISQLGTLSIDWTNQEVKDIIRLNCSYWLSYCLTNRRALSGFLQGLRYALMTLSGVSWFNNGLAEKVSMRCFNSLDAAFVSHAAVNIRTKFGIDWFNSIFRLSVGSRKLEMLVKSGALLESAIEEQTELLESSSEWTSPRLIGRGNHKSVKTALREVFKAYQFERSLNDYDTQMILVANKVSKAAFKYNAQFSRPLFCDKRPYGLWAARGYTKAPNEDDFGHLLPEGSTFNEIDQFDNELESNLAVLIMTNHLKLPSFSRRYMNVGSKLMRQAHPSGMESMAAWRLKLDLSLGLSAKSNSSSGVSKKLGNLDPQELFKQQTLLHATKLQRLIKTEQSNKLAQLLTARGYATAAANEAAKLVVLETSNQSQHRARLDKFKSQLEQNRTDGRFQLPEFIETELQEDEVKVLKSCSIDQNAELKTLVEEEFKRWLQAIQQVEGSTLNVASYRATLGLLDQQRSSSGIIGDYLQPLLSYLQECSQLQHCQFWDYGRMLTRWLLACTWLPEWMTASTGIASRSISEIDLLRLISANQEHITNIVRDELKKVLLDDPFVELILFGLSTPVEPVTMLSNICNFGKPRPDNSNVVEVSAEVVIAFIAYCLPFVNTNKVIYFEDVRLLCSISVRPLKFCLARFRRSRNIVTHRLPKPGRQKNLITVTQAVVANAQSGFSGDISQLARALTSNLTLTVLYYGRGAKAQVGPTRELPIRDPITDECLSFSEKIDEAICGFFDEEAITHPYSKKHLQDKMAAAVQSTYRTVSNDPVVITITDLSSYASKVEEFPELQVSSTNPQQQLQYVTRQLALGVNGLLDHSKWGPGHVASSFSSAMNPFTDILGSGIAQLKRLTYEGISLKDDELSPAVWHRWLSPSFDPTALPEHMQFQYKLWKELGLTAIPRPGDMGQGMLHKASSLVGIACGYIRRHIISKVIEQLGAMVTMTDQQGSDDRNCALILTFPVNFAMRPQLFEQTASAVASYERCYPSNRILTALNPTCSPFQLMLEHFAISLDVCVSRAGNHELSVKCAWSRCFSEMNSRFINAFNTINPTVRDTAPVAQGPTFGTLTETMIDLFSRSKNAASCAASELVVSYLVLANLAQIEKRYKLAPSDLNNVVQEIVTMVEGSDQATHNPFLIPYAIGGYPFPSIDRLLFCSTQEDEVMRVQFIKQNVTSSTLIYAIFMKGLSDATTVKEPKYDDLIAEVDGTFNKLASPTFGVKRRIMQRGKTAQAKLSALLDTVRDTLEQSDSFNYKYSTSEYSIMATMAPYLPAKTVVGDLQKMIKILQSPGLLRSMSDCDWTHLSWASSMIARGHVTTLPFANITTNEAFWSDSDAKAQLLDRLAIPDHERIRFHGVISWLWQTISQYAVDPAPVGYAPILLPGAKPKLDNPKSGYTLRHSLLLCFARGLILLSDQLKTGLLSSTGLLTPHSLLNPINYWSGKLIKHSYALTAGVIRRSLSRSEKKGVNPLFSDCQFKETEMPGMLYNPPIKAIFAYHFPREFVLCQGRLPKAKSLLRDIEILSKHCSDQMKMLVDLIGQSSELGRTAELDALIAQVVLSIWTNCASILPKDIKALLPCSKLLGATKKLQLGVCRSIVHNIEFIPNKQITKLWDDKVALEFMSELDSERQMGERLQHFLSVITTISPSLESAHENAQRLFQTGVIARTKLRSTLLSWLQSPIPFAVETSAYGQTILLKKLAMQWFCQGFVDSELLCQSAQVGVVIHNFSQSTAIRPDVIGIHAKFNSASLSCGKTFISIVVSEYGRKILVINPDTVELTKLLRYYRALVSNVQANQRMSNRLMPSELFDKVTEAVPPCHFSRDLIDLEFGPAPLDSWKLTIDSVWKTSSEPPWSMMSRLPQTAEFELKSNPPRIELVTRYMPDPTFEQELQQYDSTPLLSSSALDMIQHTYEKCQDPLQFITLNNLASRLNLHPTQLIDRRTVLRLDDVGPFSTLDETFTTIQKSYIFPPSVLHSFATTGVGTTIGSADDSPLHQLNTSIANHKQSLQPLYDVGSSVLCSMFNEPTRVCPSAWTPLLARTLGDDSFEDFTSWQQGMSGPSKMTPDVVVHDQPWDVPHETWLSTTTPVSVSASVEETLLQVMEGRDLDSGHKAALAILSLPHSGIQIASRQMESWERETRPTPVALAETQADLSLIAMTTLHRKALLSELPTTRDNNQLLTAISQCQLIMQGVTNLKLVPMTVKLLANSTLLVPLVGSLALAESKLPVTVQLICLLAASQDLLRAAGDWANADALMLIELSIQLINLVENLTDKSVPLKTNYGAGVFFKTQDGVLISVDATQPEGLITLGSASTGKFYGKLSTFNNWSQHWVRNRVMRVNPEIIALTNWIGENLLMPLFPEPDDQINFSTEVKEDL